MSWHYWLPGAAWWPAMSWFWGSPLPRLLNIQHTAPRAQPCVHLQPAEHRRSPRRWLWSCLDRCSSRPPAILATNLVTSTSAPASHSRAPTVVCVIHRPEEAATSLKLLQDPGSTCPHGARRRRHRAAVVAARLRRGRGLELSARPMSSRVLSDTNKKKKKKKKKKKNSSTTTTTNTIIIQQHNTIQHHRIATNI